MTKADLVETVYKAIGPGISQNECALVINGFLEAMRQTLERGERIEIRRFGTFQVRERRPRMARNPHTGESLHVPAHHVPVFKPSKLLKEIVRAGPAEGSGLDGRNVR